MNDFAGKLENFWNVFMNAGGYREVLKGLQNTLTIAVLGLLIGIVIGTVIAAVRVLPKYKRLPRVLNSICGFYVGLFRGTPMVVQLLVFYYVLLPLLGVTRLPSVTVATLVFGLNSGAYISEIMRSGILSVDSGQMEGGRSVGLSYGVTMLRIVIPPGGQEHPAHAGQRIHRADQGDLGRQLRRRDRPVRRVQQHRQQQLRVYGALPCHGHHLHRAGDGHQRARQADGKEPEKK